jgi:hypothetical protein
MTSGRDALRHPSSGDERRWQPVVVGVGVVGLAAAVLFLAQGRTSLAVLLGLAGAFTLVSGLRPRRKPDPAVAPWTRSILARVASIGVLGVALGAIGVLAIAGVIEMRTVAAVLLMIAGAGFLTFVALAIRAWRRSRA